MKGWLSAWGALAVLLCLGVAAGATGATMAGFGSSATVTGDAGALAFADVVVLRPGSARRADGTPIARLEGGRLVLDFGPVRPGAQRSAGDLLRLEHAWSRGRPVAVELDLDMDHPGLTGQVMPGRLVLEPGGKRPVGARVKASRGAAPGRYEGVLELRALEGFLVEQVRVRLEVSPARGPEHREHEDEEKGAGTP